MPTWPRPPRAKFASVAPAATTNTVVYTVPTSIYAATEVVVHIANINTGAQTFRLWVVHSGGTTTYFDYDKSVGASDSRTYALMSLNPGDTVNCYASATNVYFTVMCVEI